MEKAIKLIITEEASEFSQESNATMENYNITPAFCSKDGEELLNRIKAEQPDVVLMDSFMTRLDAIGVMRSVRRDKLKAPFHSILIIPQRNSRTAGYEFGSVLFCTQAV